MLLFLQHKVKRHGEELLGWRQVSDELRRVHTQYYRSVFINKNRRWTQTSSGRSQINISIPKQT